MHSTTFTDISRAADYDLGRTVVAMCEIPPSQGCFPAAWVVASKSDLDTPGQFSDAHAAFDYSIHRAIIGKHEMDNGTPVFFDCGTYDLDYPTAMRLFGEKVERETRMLA